MKAKYKDKLVEIIELKSTSFVDLLQKQSETVPLFSVDYICAVNKEYQIYRYVDVKANRVKYALEYVIDYNTAYAIICDTKIDFKDLVKWFERDIWARSECSGACRRSIRDDAGDRRCGNIRTGADTGISAG